MNSIMAGRRVEQDFGLSMLENKEPSILGEAIRRYTYNGDWREQPVITLQGVTSEPRRNKFGASKSSYHFQVHTTDQATGEDVTIPVSVFNSRRHPKLAEQVAAVLDFRQAFVKLRGDYRLGSFTATRGPRQGEDIESATIAINFENQIEVLAVFAPEPSAWARAAEAISKGAEAQVAAGQEDEELPF